MDIIWIINFVSIAHCNVSLAYKNLFVLPVLKAIIWRNLVASNVMNHAYNAIACILVSLVLMNIIHLRINA